MQFKNIKWPMLLLLTSFTISLTAQHKQPNFILIYCDDLGYGDLGMTGHPTIRTPHLDKMAAEGLRFTNYYAASPACTASRYALLTGKYPPRSGFRWVLNPSDTVGIHPDEITLPEYLKQVGYVNGMFGKWHLGSSQAAFMPNANGFDEYYGLPYSNDMIPPKYQDIALLHNLDTLEMNPDQSLLTERYTQQAIAFIAKNKHKPFFVYLPYAMPHTPLAPHPDFKGKSKRGAYGDVVEELDSRIGRLLDFLKKNKLDEHTYVIFTSDNGPWLLQGQNAGSAGLFKDGKGSTWEGGVREPFIVWGPKVLKANQQLENPLTALDILPTIMHLAGRKQPIPAIDGVNQAALFQHKKQAERKEIYYFGLNHQLFAVRKGKWKLHLDQYSQLGISYFEGKKTLLFDLETDPSEQYDVAQQHPALVAELTALMANKEKEIKEQGHLWENKRIK